MIKRLLPICIALALGASASVAIVQSTTGGNRATNGLAFSSAVTAGNTIVVFFSGGTSAPGNCTDSLGNSYSLAPGAQTQAGGEYMSADVAHVATGGSDTVTCAGSTDVQFQAELSGASATAPVDTAAAGQTNNSTTTLTWPAITLTQTDVVLAVTQVEVDGSAYVTWTSPMSSVETNVWGSYQAFGGATGVSAGSFTATATNPSAQTAASGGIVVAIQPSGAPPAATVPVGAECCTPLPACTLALLSAGTSCAASISSNYAVSLNVACAGSMCADGTLQSFSLVPYVAPVAPAAQPSALQVVAAGNAMVSCPITLQCATLPYGVTGNITIGWRYGADGKLSELIITAPSAPTGAGLAGDSKLIPITGTNAINQ